CAAAPRRDQPGMGCEIASGSSRPGGGGSFGVKSGDAPLVVTRILSAGPVNGLAGRGAEVTGGGGGGVAVPGAGSLGADATSGATSTGAGLAAASAGGFAAALLRSRNPAATA